MQVPGWPCLFLNQNLRWGEGGLAPAFPPAPRVFLCARRSANSHPKPNNSPGHGAPFTRGPAAKIMPQSVCFPGTRDCPRGGSWQTFLLTGAGRGHSCHFQAMDRPPSPGEAQA